MGNSDISVTGSAMVEEQQWMRFGVWLSECRKKLNLTQEAAAQRAHINKNNWSRYEGGAKAKPKTIISLARAVNQPTSIALAKAGFDSDVIRSFSDDEGQAIILSPRFVAWDEFERRFDMELSENQRAGTGLPIFLIRTRIKNFASYYQVNQHQEHQKKALLQAVGMIMLLFTDGRGFVAVQDDYNNLNKREDAGVMMIAFVNEDEAITRINRIKAAVIPLLTGQDLKDIEIIAVPADRRYVSFRSLLQAKI